MVGGQALATTIEKSKVTLEHTPQLTTLVYRSAWRVGSLPSLHPPAIRLDTVGGCNQIPSTALPTSRAGCTHSVLLWVLLATSMPIFQVTSGISAWTIE